MKSDTSIRNICLAAIKRKTIGPLNFTLTRTFETENIPDILATINFLLMVDELPIVQVKVDTKNWTCATTRRVVTCLNGVLRSVEAAQISVCNWGHFKDDRLGSFTVGKILNNIDQEVPIIIETGRASIMMIYAIQTLTNLIEK